MGVASPIDHGRADGLTVFSLLRFDLFKNPIILLWKSFRSLQEIHFSRIRKKLHIFSQDSIVFCSICQIWINALEAWLARQFLTDSDAKFMSVGESKK